MHAATATIRRWKTHAWRSVVVATLLAAVAGCGVGVVYPRLDTIAAYYVEGLVTLDDAQSEQLDRLLTEGLARHRASEPQRYATFLRTLAGSIAHEADAGTWQRAVQQTDAFWHDIGAELAPVAIGIGRTLTDEQVGELLANLERRDEEEWREFGDLAPAEQVQRRQKRVRRTLERFTGSLDVRQRALVDEHAARAGSFTAEWLDNRRAWREHLAAALAVRGSGEEFARRMTTLVARPDELWTPRYRKAIERRRAETVELLAALDATLTPRQRDRASGRLNSLASELARLAQPKERKQPA
jgi:Family of unknown function (DUF6279)